MKERVRTRSFTVDDVLKNLPYAGASGGKGLQHALQELHQLRSRVLALLALLGTRLFRAPGCCGFSATTAGRSGHALNDTLNLAEDISEASPSTSACSAATTGSTAASATE